TNGKLTQGAQADLDNLSWNISGLSNVERLTGPTRPDGLPVDATNMTGLTPQQRLAILGSIGSDRRTALVTVLFVEEPFTPKSLDTVNQIRRLVTSLQRSDASLAQDTILVGGASASTLDFSNETVSQFNTMRVLTVAAIFLVLLVVLGSYPLAITGILSIGLSITWAYAATLLFFNNVLQSGVLFIIPLVLFLLLYGIGMDYNIFILTRIREEAQKGKETRQAVVDAVDRTGGIITALALILDPDTFPRVSRVKCDPFLWSIVHSNRNNRTACQRVLGRQLCTDRFRDRCWSFTRKARNLRWRKGIQGKVGTE